MKKVKTMNNLKVGDSVLFEYWGMNFKSCKVTKVTPKQVKLQDNDNPNRGGSYTVNLKDNKLVIKDTPEAQKRVKAYGDRSGEIDKERLREKKELATMRSNLKEWAARPKKVKKVKK